ncbi:hypothetical protein OG622_32840 [Streptomyces sp. NBC_01314]|nr:hypothetical protein OG622_32840 [Streptomyces sp. NBC_01314]
MGAWCAAKYAERTEAESRSAVIHAAIELLRRAQLEQEYTAAFAESERSEDAALRDRTRHHPALRTR